MIEIPLSLIIDRIFGEPPKFHPLVGFGKLADRIEIYWNEGKNRFLFGIIAWFLCVIPFVVLAALLESWFGWWFTLLCGWLAIGWQSLREHGQRVFEALKNNDLKTARERIGYLVSRDTSKLDETEISCACTESILENGNDAVFAPLFWLAIGGAPLVVLYRLSNTLDAMWGYRNQQFEQFGKFAAKTDDLLNWIPARITAFFYALSGNWRDARRAWKTQGTQWHSPNAGIVMAAGAGALGVKLGGDAIYHGKTKVRLELGFGTEPNQETVSRAIRLLDKSIYKFAIIALLLAII